jgi:cytochrome c peroxidase
VRGFNIFAGSGKCATCHFAPTFSGLVPPDFHESESEVLGVPLADEDKATLDPDLGRFNHAVINQNAPHYKYAFKTPTVRNIEYTAPYMHNGVFKTLDDVMIFYNRGGGANIGIDLPNRTLSDTPLRLPPDERNDVIAFLNSLSDTTGLTTPPRRLPKIGSDKALNDRIIGGRY